MPRTDEAAHGNGNVKLRARATGELSNKKLDLDANLKRATSGTTIDPTEE